MFSRSLENDEADPTVENILGVRLLRALDRMREVDAVNRQKLRVLQVALEETWAVAKILEENQYKEEVEPDLASARKEAAGAKKRKKEKEEAISESSSEDSSESSSEDGVHFEA